MSIEQNEHLKPPVEKDEKIAASTALSQDALGSAEMTGRHGGFYPPYPMPHYEPPVSRISVSPPGFVVPSVELVMGANKDAAVQEEVGRHGGWYPPPYPTPEFHRPTSRFEVSPPGHLVPSVELVMGANKDADQAIQTAAQETVGHRHYNPYMPNPYQTPHYEPPVVRISAGPGIVRPSH